MSDESETQVQGETETVADEDVDRAAESFLDIESQLRTSGPTKRRGRAVDVERIPAEKVPENYPVEMTTPEALALRLVVDEQRETTVYFEYDEGAADDRLGRLLALHDIPPDRFADLHGESILLAVEDGHYVPVVPEESPRGSSVGVYGVVAGLAVNILTVALVVVGLGGLLSSLGVVLALVAINIVGLPIATYVDGWYLRTRTDWGQWPAFWAILAAIPGLNILSTMAYLWTRRNTTHLA